MELSEVMKKRKSIRKYAPAPIPADTLQAIVDAARLAPTSMNRKPCDFRVITDRETLDRLAEAKKGGAGMLREAAAAIIVVSDTEKADTIIEDSSIAMTYLMLAAVDQGIDNCWVQFRLRRDAEDRDAVDHVRELLDLPENCRPLHALALGLPRE
ncbi:MAG: nitroreductase family protein [Mogibacterium sp.]|nr:nitroreductase family protein [Mogibacterium sp.]